MCSQNRAESKAFRPHAVGVSFHSAKKQQAVSTTLAARHPVRQTQLPTCGTPPGWWEMVGASAHAAADEVTVIAQSKTTFLLRWVLFLSLLVSMFIVFAAGSASSVFWVTSVCFRLDFHLSFLHFV